MSFKRTYLFVRIKTRYTMKNVVPISMNGFDFGFKMTFNICLKFKKDAFNNRFLLQSKHPNKFSQIIPKKKHNNKNHN